MKRKFMKFKMWMKGVYTNLNPYNNFEHMFDNIVSLKNLDASHFYTNDVTNMTHMFQNY